MVYWKIANKMVNLKIVNEMVNWKITGNQKCKQKLEMKIGK